MRQKSLAHLDIVMVKDTEDPIGTVVKFTDTQPAAAGPDEEDKQTMEENKENIGAQQMSADDEEGDVVEKVRGRDEHKHTPQTSTCLTSPSNIVDTQVLYHYVIVIIVFFHFYYVMENCNITFPVHHRQRGTTCKVSGKWRNLTPMTSKYLKFYKFELDVHHYISFRTDSGRV